MAAEPTHVPPSGTDQQQTGTWCHWHKGPSQTAVVVDAIERTSGPPILRWACAPCREQRGLVAVAG